MKPESYPWLTAPDYDAIDKGHVFSVAEVERITGARRSSALHVTRRNIFAMMLQKEMEVRDRPYTVCERRGTVAVLTDAEAAAHNHKWQIRYARRMRKRNRLQQAVDATQLDAEQRRKHERALVCDGAVIASMAETRKEIRAATARRNIPGVEVWQALQKV